MEVAAAWALLSVGCVSPMIPRDMLLWAKAPHKVCKGSTVWVGGKGHTLRGSKALWTSGWGPFSLSDMFFFMQSSWRDSFKWLFAKDVKWEYVRCSRVRPQFQNKNQKMSVTFQKGIFSLTSYLLTYYTYLHMGPFKCIFWCSSSCVWPWCPWYATCGTPSLFQG